MGCGVAYRKFSYLQPSSSWSGHRTFTSATRVQIPSAVPIFNQKEHMDTYTCLTSCCYDGTTTATTASVAYYFTVSRSYTPSWREISMECNTRKNTRYSKRNIYLRYALMTFYKKRTSKRTVRLKDYVKI